MTDKEKLALIYRVVSGYTVIGEYIIDTPDDSLINESLAVYQDVLRKYRFEGLLLQEETEQVLMRKGLWKPVNNINLRELDKSLDDCKLELFNHYGMPPTQIKKVRDRLHLIKTKIIEQHNIKHSLDHFTIEGLAEKTADIYVFSKVVLDKNYNHINLPVSQLEYLMNRYKKKWASNTDMRLVARTEPWRSFWATNPSCFRVQGDEQKVLILFSKMYDNVYEHSERPADGIIDDDDMLDGWFINIKRKNEQVRKENIKNSVVQKHPKANHIFMMAGDNQELVKEINDMNSIEAKLIKTQRNELMKQKELVRDKDVPMLNIGK